MINIINFSGGVQSTTLLLMSILGEIDRADAAVFADTGWERKSTYETVEWVSEFAKQHDFPIHFCKHPKMTIREHILNVVRGDEPFLHIPAYSKTGDGTVVKGKQQCTSHFKIAPIRREIVKHYGQHYCQWFGISIDETQRMKSPNWKRVTHRYPLVEERISRNRCVEWLKARGFPIPDKSACIGCPLHSTPVWKDLNGAERADAISVDRAVQTIKTQVITKSKTFDKNQIALDIDIPDRHIVSAPQPNYLHNSATPLEEALQKNYDDPDYDLESEECSGSCFI